MPRIKKTINDNELCKHNPAVECLLDCKTCNKCGWNPDVNEQRKKEWRENNNGTIY